MYATALYIQTSHEHHMSSALMLRVNYACNECLYCLRSIYTSSTCRVHTYWHVARVFVKFKSSCTVYGMHASVMHISVKLKSSCTMDTK